MKTRVFALVSVLFLLSFWGSASADELRPGVWGIGGDCYISPIGVAEVRAGWHQSFAGAGGGLGFGWKTKYAFMLYGQYTFGYAKDYPYSIGYQSSWRLQIGLDVSSGHLMLGPYLLFGAAFRGGDHLMGGGGRIGYRVNSYFAVSAGVEGGTLRVYAPRWRSMLDIAGNIQLTFPW